MQPFMRINGTPAKARVSVRESRQGPLVNFRFTLPKGVKVEDEGTVMVTKAPAPVAGFRMGMN